MSREAHECPNCKAVKSLYQTCAVSDESSHEFSIGYARQVTYSCAECSSRFVVKETRKVTKVKDLKAPNWIVARYRKTFNLDK